MKSEHNSYLLVGNGGNGTVAALQWIIHSGLANVTFVSVATGFCDVSWEERIDTIHEFARLHGIPEKRLHAKAFAHWVEKKNSFPSRKFPWCAQMLKGFPINDYLDDIDPAGNVIVILAKLRSNSRASEQVTEWLEGSPHFGQRRVWHPLWTMSQEESQRLVHEAGFAWLAHRSLECDPCIYNSNADFVRLSSEAEARVTALEKNVQAPMFGQPLAIMIKNAQAENDHSLCSEYPLNQFDMGCGAPYGCGI
jgi:hypothetical protein